MATKEYTAFVRLVDNTLAVPASTIKERAEAHRREAAMNPNRPGPKPKKKRKAVKPSAVARASRAKG